MRGVAAVVVLLSVAGPATASLPALDLSKPFATRSAWRFTATQGPDVEDPGGNAAPGTLRLCVSRDGGRTCAPDLTTITPGDHKGVFAEPHYLGEARIVHPPGGAPLLLLRFASLHSGDGDQSVAARLLAYDRKQDRFLPVYAHETGRNRNEEMRYVATGPLAGAMIAAEPTDDAPYGYWIAVSRPRPGCGYVQVLRFRSATRYGDGNSLAAIDSEMPGIERRPGLWHAGQALPVPAGHGCGRPRLRSGELWCR